jgi:DNA-binding GntR family transcriptional regulator
VTALGAIRIGSLRDEATRAIRAAIASGEIVPGEIYSAPALAQRLGVSPTPVREAMLNLASAGVVEAVRNRGFRIAPLTARDLDEVLELRELVEVPLLGRLAGTLDAATAGELRRAADAVADAAASGPPDELAARDGALYEQLVSLCDNAPARELLIGLRDHARLHRLTVRCAAAHGAELTAAQRRLVDALESGSRAATERAAREHLAVVRRAWSDALAAAAAPAAGA